MSVSKAALDDAIASRSALTLRCTSGELIVLTVDNYDHRFVRGWYRYKGADYKGTFDRSDLDREHP